MRRGSQSIVANPVLVGAVTTLVVVVAVFLAYNANNGLPFVPTRSIDVELSSGSNLVKGNEVREGGFRIGVVEELKPITLKSGQTVALAKLKLDKAVGDIPADTRMMVRPRSALGLKFVQLERGRSDKNLVDGDTIPVDQTNVPVQFDDIFKIFDQPTRRASQENLKIFGNGFTGRGVDLNLTIETLGPLFQYLTPVARNLSDERTQLGRFFAELGDAARIIAPISGVQAKLFTDMATTFEAFSRSPEALKATIQKSPGTLVVGERSLRQQRPFLRDLADFSVDLRGVARELRISLPIINPAIETGTPVLRRSVDLNRRTAEVLVAAKDLAEAPTTNTALRALTDTVTTLNPMLRYLGPHQTVCNGWNYFWGFLGEHISEPDATGTSQRANLHSVGRQRNGLDQIGAVEPANGEDYTGPPQRGDPQFLHGQAYHAAINDDGTADCENGQRGYPEGDLTTFGSDKYKIVLDPHTPGSQGPTFAGRSRTPPGQTFTREPETGAQLDPILTTGIYAGR